MEVLGSIIVVIIVVFVIDEDELFRKFMAFIYWDPGLVVPGSGHIGCKKSHHRAAAVPANLLTRLGGTLGLGKTHRGK